MTSSPFSFHMASNYPSSSPRSTPASDAAFPYREARLLPTELREQCQVYFEEKLYVSALNLLQQTTVSGTSNAISTAAFTPPPDHIAILPTLLVHPRFTNPSTEYPEVSSRSFILLSSILDTLGPLNADLSTAFTFSSPIRSIRRGRNQSDSEGSESEGIDSPFATTQSLWSSADSFWDVVGWSFNCSVIHKRRWEHWQVLLSFLVDVLDADWHERARLDNVEPSSSPSGDILRQCLLLKYLRPHGRHFTFRRLVRSIFADGSAECVKAYPAIFGGEVLSRENGSSRKRKRADTTRERPLDLANSQFGAYSSESDDVCSDGYSSDELTSNRPPPSPSDALGGLMSLRLRLRLLAMLSRASFYFPDCVLPISDLYSLLYEHIRPLPLPLFSLLMSATAVPSIPREMLVSLTQLILTRLLPSAAPPSTQVNDELSQDILERCYLPWSAQGSSVDENAKVGICVEILVRIFVTSGGEVEDLESLNSAVEKGIAAREKKIAANTSTSSTTIKRRGRPRKGEEGGGGNGANSNDIADAKALKESGERLRCLMLCLMAGTGA